MSIDVELSSLPARINLYLNSANRTLGDSASSFEMTMANTLVTADFGRGARQRAPIRS